ncbi:hypothetical protein BDZ90DRAFT_108176 [Jaminaea rosea]|uniref:Uncharacterized protein n=1 Tax=Jaminaea rosea TaxID=1569628 RepID=A0A316UVU5_9BASI|nr:hypothetical protein BDZ90DRAFT_108176 [Jaminaea rosea]PWN29410.1 hypothetical protein BDZ90DRAFT_108176 [Jaminaea rosea]
MGLAQAGRAGSDDEPGTELISRRAYRELSTALTSLCFEITSWLPHGSASLLAPTVLGLPICGPAVPLLIAHLPCLAECVAHISNFGHSCGTSCGGGSLSSVRLDGACRSGHVDGLVLDLGGGHGRWGGRSSQRRTGPEGANGRGAEGGLNRAREEHRDLVVVVGGVVCWWYGKKVERGPETLFDIFEAR